MTEDEMDIDEQATSAKPRTPGLEAKVGLLEAHKPRLSRELSAFDGSFHSAKEDLTWEASKEPGGRRVKGTVSPQAQAPKAIRSTDGLSSPQMVQTEKSDDCAMETEPAEKASLMDEDVGNDSLRSPSEGSSPGLKSLVRKSSLTFATLPAREPLTTKKSTGARLSRTSHLDVMSRGSFLGRITGGKSLGGSRQPVTAAEPHDDDDVDVGGIQQSSGGHEESDSEAEAAKLHNKSSTQRLHDRINMLVQSQPARPKKSIPTAAAPSQPVYPELPTPPTMNDNAQTSSREDEEDDDWIQPPSPRTKPSPRPQLSKSISADVMENLRGKTNISDEQFGRTINEQQPSPRRHSLDSERDSSNVATSGQAATGASESPFKAVRANEEILSTTPLGTPVTARHVDGPISASKSKLQSIMKTARGLFTSSAGASAQAKMELRNQAELGSPKIPAPSKSTPKEVVTVLYPCLPLGQKNNATYGARPENPAKPPEGRRTRGSIEKEKKEKERQQIDEELEKRRDENLLSQRQSQRDQNLAYDEHDGPTPPPKPQQQPTKKSPRRLQTQQTAAPAPENIGENTQNTASVKGSQPPTSQRSQLQKPRDVRRAVKPAKETAPKPEPQRVAIRVGTLTLRNPLSNAALSAGLQDPALPPSDTQPNLAKKTSTVSLQTSASNSSLKSTTTSKPKALIAAEKKKEQVRLLLFAASQHSRIVH